MKFGSLSSSTDGHKIWHSNQNSSTAAVPAYQENKYSANDTINNFVIATRQNNQNMSRNDLAKLPIDYQMAIFRSLNNENKIRIYTEKINFVISNDQLSQAEANHLRAVISFMKPEYYNRGHDQFVTEFYENWKNVAINKLNLDVQKTEIYVETWLTRSELINVVHTTRGGEREGSGEPPPSDCECNSSWFCGLRGVSCTHQGCQRTDDGCGFLSLYSCKGHCTLDAKVTGSSTTF